MKSLGVTYQRRNVATLSEPPQKKDRDREKNSRLSFSIGEVRIHNSSFSFEVKESGFATITEILRGKPMDRGLDDLQGSNFYIQKMREIKRVYYQLNYSKSSIFETIGNIITSCISLAKFDIEVSRTGEDEILIFRKVNGTFNNIIIDQEGNIEFLCIPPNRVDSYNQYYSSDEADASVLKLAIQL
jgi:hypothetical protein